MRYLWFAFLFFIALGFTPAQAQCNGVFAANNYCGSVAGGPPGQVSLGSLGAPNYPVIHPTLTNSGAAPAHSLLWNDNNWILSLDEIAMNSTDPSALLSFTPTGTPTNTATVTLTFKFGSGACISSGAGCTATTTVTSGESLTNVIAALVTAIKGNANLYNNVAGAQGQILAVSSAGTTLSLDFNSNVAMTVAFTDSASTITSNLPVACATACSAALDTNPQFAISRSSGAAPVAGSTLGTISFNGTQSTSPTSIGTTYGQILTRVLNSTSGSILGQLGFTAGNSNAADGFFLGNGICTAAYATSNGCGGVNTLTIGEIFGGTAANAAPTIRSTSNGSASGDTLTLEASSVIVRGYGGGANFDCGIANSVGCLGLVLAGTSSGATTLSPSAVASGTLTLPAATDQLVARATSDTLTNKTLGAPVSMALGSDATGDIYYLNSSGNLTRLGIGSNTNVLSVSAGGLPQWSPAIGGAMTYLCTITASNSATLTNISNCAGLGAGGTFTNAYTSYELIFQAIVPASDQKILEFQIHSGGAYKATGYLSTHYVCAGASCAGGNVTTYIPLTYATDSNAVSLHNAAPGFSNTVIITNPSANAIAMVTSGNGGYISEGSGVTTVQSSGYWNTAAAVDGFQVLMDSGNITSGSILVYGIE